MKLKENFEKSVSDIVKAFEQKHDCNLEYWVSDDLTGVACFGDVYFFNLSDICHDVFTNQPKGLIFTWLEKSVENQDLNISFISYCKGLRFKQLRKFNNK